MAVAVKFNSVCLRAMKVGEAVAFRLVLLGWRRKNPSRSVSE